MEFTDKSTFHSPAPREFIGVDTKDWARLKKLARRVDAKQYIWDGLFFSFLGATLTVGITHFLTYGKSVEGDALLSLVILGALVVIMLVVLGGALSSRAKGERSDLLEEMQLVEDDFRKAKEEGGLYILHATYGAEGEWVDVTEKLREVIKDDHLEVVASNSLAGDPSPGKVKALVVRYSMGKNEATGTAKEGETLSLP